MEQDVWYHGSRRDFDEFNLNLAEQIHPIRMHGRAIYLTSDESLAKAYATQSGFLYKVKFENKTNTATPFDIHNLEATESKSCLAIYDCSELIILEKIKL